MWTLCSILPTTTQNIVQGKGKIAHASGAHFITLGVSWDKLSTRCYTWHGIHSCSNTHVAGTVQMGMGPRRSMGHRSNRHQPEPIQGQVDLASCLKDKGCPEYGATQVQQQLNSVLGELCLASSGRLGRWIAPWSATGFAMLAPSDSSQPGWQPERTFVVVCTSPSVRQECAHNCSL